MLFVITNTRFKRLNGNQPVSCGEPVSTILKHGNVNIAVVYIIEVTNQLRQRTFEILNIVL